MQRDFSSGPSIGGSGSSFLVGQKLRAPSVGATTWNQTPHLRAVRLSPTQRACLELESGLMIVYLKPRPFVRGLPVLRDTCAPNMGPTLR